MISRKSTRKVHDLEPEAEEDQRAAGERAPHRARDQLVFGGGDQVVEEVVLGEHQRLRLAENPEDVVHHRLARGSARGRRRAAAGGCSRPGRQSPSSGRGSRPAPLSVLSSSGSAPAVHVDRGRQLGQDAGRGSSGRLSCDHPVEQLGQRQAAGPRPASAAEPPAATPRCRPFRHSASRAELRLSSHRENLGDRRGPCARGRLIG